jgi:hypothetical protein
MTEHLDRTADDRESDAQTVAASGRKARERFEDSRQLVFRNADARVVYVDPDFGPAAAAADQDAPSGLCVSYGIGQQIAEDATEQHRITHYMGIRGNRSKIDAPLNGGIVVFVLQPPEQRPKSHGGDLQRIGAFSQVKGIHQTIELFGQLRDGPLPSVQPYLLRHFFQARAQQRVGSLNDVQGLPEVVSQHTHNRCLKFLRDEGFQLPILHVRRDDEAFNRFHVVPCWLSMIDSHEKPADRVLPSYISVPWISLSYDAAAVVRLQAERLDRAGSEPGGTSQNRNAFGLKTEANF